MALTTTDILGLPVLVSSTGTDIYIPVSSVLAQTSYRISARALMATSLPSVDVLSPSTAFTMPVVSTTDGLAYSVTVSEFLTALHGLPGGGTTGQLLSKTSNADYAVNWVNAGTVFSVGLSMPAIFSVGNSPITTSGTINVTLATEVANTVWAGPTIGVDATPTFRSLVVADLPTVTVAHGGTGLTSLTAHDLIVGAGTSAATLLAPSATSGIPLVSQGASADPAYSTAVVAGGGTGLTSATAYAVLCGGTSSTGAFQSVASVGTSGQALLSNGASLLPTFQSITAAGLTVGTSTIASGTTTRILYDNAGVLGEYTTVPLAVGGTNAALTASNGGIFYSTGSAGAILSGTATANQILMSGSSTTPAWSTATYPATAAVGTILNASGANVLAATTTPTLGASGTLGTLSFGNASSGTITLSPVAGALGSVTLSLPAVSDTLAGKALANGGTNAALTADNGGIVYSTAAALAILAHTTTANQPLLSGASTTPSWAIVSYPTLVNSGAIPYFSSTTAMQSSALLTQFGPVYGGGAGNPPVSMAAATDGQLIVGQTSAAPLWKTASGDLTVAASGAFTIAANAVTLAKLATQATNTVLANITAGTAVPTAATLTSIIDTISGANVQGSILFRGSSAWQALAPSSSGRVLTTNGAALDPSWTAAPGSGTVTNVASGSGLVGGPITTSGTLTLQQLVPGGRLTLTSATPVMTADTAAAQNIYYAPYNHCFCPVFNGTNMQLYQFTSGATDATGLTLALAASANWVSGSVYDLFYAYVTGVFYFGTGPAWTSTTSRGAGTALQMYDGVLTNNISMTLRYGAASTITVPANQGTYLGSFYCGGAAAGNGTCDMTFKPAAASGGNNGFMSLWNAYNRVPMQSLCRDSTASWSSSATVSYVPWNSTVSSGTSNRITVLDGLAQSTVTTSVGAIAQSASGSVWSTGINQDSTSATPNLVLGGSGNATNSSGSPTENFSPALGLHYYQAMMKGNVSGQYFTFNGSPFSGIVVRLDM